MVTNMGSTDRIVRAILGVALLSLVFIIEGNARWIGLLGVVLLFTVAVNWCPLYSLVGINTSKGKS